MFKITRPLGNSENALPVQIVSAFVTDLLLRAFKHSSGFTSSLYEFVSNCQEFSLVPLKELANNALRRALETIFRLFDDTGSGWVYRVRTSSRPSVVGMCTSSICTAANFTLRGVNPGAKGLRPLKTRKRSET
ncbi:MAG: hypothetical protein LC776_11875 [Acidobacteria bacterium]|nr:hypothetical protein [Acidobacteriota bacterium]